MSARGPEKPMRLACSDDRGSGRPVLLVHGVSHTRCVWQTFAEGLDADDRPIAVDLRGHGESEWSPEGHYALHDYAADLPATLDELGIERAVVVAHSLGGNAATLFAAAAPERVEALVLVDTGPALSLGGALHVVEGVGEAIRSYASIDAFREQLSMIHPAADPALLARMAETGLVRRRDGRFEPALDPGVLGGPLDPEAIAAIECELWDALAAVRCPTLVVRGGLSAILSEEVAEKMTAVVLRAGQLATCAGAGHGVMLDDAPGLLRHTRRFLAALAPTGSSQP